ncbi:FtsX-like permease family protein [Dactylosporangium vinaceum]|nr:FtsX-like permease family protein [Dactylosporangium vinaceum]
MIRMAFGALRTRPASFAGLAAALFLAVSAIAMFGSLLAAAATGGGSDLGAIGGAFGEIVIIMATFVAVTTLGFAVRQQHRELALLRTVAATPRQVRRLIRCQVAGLTLLVSPPAWALGAIAARLFLRALVDRGLAPAGATVPAGPLPLLLATPATALAGLIAAAFATWRISHGPPSAALVETAAPTGGIGRVRGGLGLLVAGGAGALCRFVAGREPDEAAQGALLSALALMVALALLGPWAARLVVTVLGLPLRLARGAGAGGWLAAVNLRGHAHRLSSAVVPIALLVGLSTTFVVVTATMRHAAAVVVPEGDVWLRGVEVAMLALFGTVATLSTLVALTADRRREYALLRLVGATRRQLVRALAAEAVLTALTGAVLGTAVAAPAAVAFALAVGGGPVPYVSVGSDAPILAGAMILAVATQLGAGLRVIALDPATTLAAP